MNDNTNNISNVLQQVRLLKNKYNELAAVTGEDFNIFSILRIKHREVITHTPMLAELLNPHASHRQGATFLKLFLETCFNEQERKQEPAVCNNSETFRVRTEERTDRGQFDIFLEKKKEACIVIENKIHTGARPHQLNNYYQDAIESGFNQIKLIYLTLDGSEPSEESLKAVNGQGNDLSIDDVILISYREHIIKWLEECMKLQEVQRISPIREILFQYRDLLNELTGQPINKRYSMDLIELLIRDKNYELIPHLEQALLELKVQTKLKFWQELANVIPKMVDQSGIHDKQEEEGEALEVKIRNYYTASRNRFWFGTTFKLGSFSWKQPEIALRVEMGNGFVFYGFILFQDGKRVESCDDNEFNTLAEKLSDNDFVRNNWWLGWKYPKRDLGFPVKYEESEAKTLLFLPDDKRRKAVQELVKELVTEIVGEVNKLKKNLN